MNMKKKLSILLACALVLFGMTACTGGGDAGSQEAAPSTDAPASETTTGDDANENPITAETPAGDYNTSVTLQIFVSKVEIVDQLEALAAEYTAETGVKVEVLGSAGDAYMDNLLAKLTSGQGPTILSVSPGTSLERLNSYLYDLSNQPYVPDIADNLALEYEGKVLGVPYGVEGYGFVYNKDLVDPAQMTDLATFTEVANALSADGIDAVELSDAAYFLLGHIANIPFALQEDYMNFLEKLNSGEVTMAETPEFQEWAQFMEVIRATSANPMGITYDDQVANFATGKTAMIHQGNWVWGMFDDYPIDFEMGIAPMPVMGNSSLAVGMPNAWCINKEASEDEIAEALKLFTWMFTSETGHRYIVEEFRFIPALKSVQANSLDPLSTVVHEYTNSGKTIPWTYSYWPSGMIVNHLFPVGQKFFSDASMTPDQFLQELDAAWQAGQN